MSFNTALSGLKAASNDLKITGSNIANASTVGYKQSRAEFSDVYAASILGAGTEQIGGGVTLSNVSQQFQQGSLSFTTNSLDMAIDGEGFFVLDSDGSQSYTRAGLFGLDRDGFIVSNGDARLQGFSANAQGTINGILGDVFVETGNLAPVQTTQVESQVNVNAEASVLASFGTTISTTGPIVGEAQGGVAIDTASVLLSSAPPTAFDFSVNSNTAITSNTQITPFDFSRNDPSSVTGTQTIRGFDFSLNEGSTLASSSAPIFFNFSTRFSAVTAAAPLTTFDFSAPTAGGSFDVTIANGTGGNGNTTVTVNLGTAVTDITSLLADINDDLGAIDVTAVESPPGSGAIEFRASVAGEPSTVTIDNYVSGGAGVTVADIQAALGGITDGSASSGTTFDITVAGGTGDGTVTINLTSDITSFVALISDIQDQLSVSGFAVDVRADPANNGRLQFFSTDNGVGSTITVDNFSAGTSDTSLNNLTSLLGVTDGATSATPGVGAVGVTGSLTAASFDLIITGGSGLGGTATTTIDLDQSFANGDISGLVSAINSQLNALPTPGIDVRAQEDPNNAGQIQFYATIPGEASTITVNNFQLSGVSGGTTTTNADIASLLGGITEGSVATNGANTTASFEIRLTGGANGAANQTLTITLDDNIQTLGDLISDIRDDLQNSGIGLDVREDPTQPGQGKLQFFSTVSGEASLIEIDPNGALVLGNGVSQLNVENVLGRIAMGASNTDPDPAGTTGTQGSVGNITSASFDVTLAGASNNNGGPVTITLDTNVQDVSDLISDIQDELRLSNLGVDVREDPNNPGQIQFFATVAGEAAVITVNNFNTSNAGVTAANLTDALSLDSGITIEGVSAVDNGYPSQSVNVVNSTDALAVTTTVTTLAGESAAEIAARFNEVPGVSASASTTARLSSADYVNTSGNLQISVNSIQFNSDSLTDLADEINTSPALRGISAEIDTATGDLLVSAGLGNDLVFAINSTDNTDTISVVGSSGQSITLDLAGGSTAASIGGTVDLILDEAVTLDSASPDQIALFGSLAEANFIDFEINSFDPNNQDTYNSATSVTIFDSLGNAHVMTEFFVKEPFREGEIGSKPNQWTMYVQIDGVDVGDPDPTLPPPQNTQATQAGFLVQFNEAGELVPAETESMHITNWTPLDADGNPSGALGPLNILEGATLPITQPFLSSNFVIDLGNSTQFGSLFSVNSVDQDGFTTGRLSGLDISDSGIIFARYTNGENKTLGQVVLANFANNQGLNNTGGASWTQTFESGEPIIGTPGSASLGSVNSGALEDSNVELSDQLVKLIIAQRNFQASAKTIQTIDTITQTIINLR
ncbi:MAG: flagellar hook-basal body complex protein [Pseudomonadales bacterium]|nr:flagellar hook-basal body complex protein [Pseudomonadales bacterium]